MVRRTEAPDKSMTSTTSMIRNGNDNNKPTSTFVPITKPGYLVSMSPSLSHQGRRPRDQVESKFDAPRSIHLRPEHQQQQQHGGSNLHGVNNNVHSSTIELPVSFRPLISCNCLIIPVFLGIWWFWFRRKATSVFHKLRIQDQRHETTAGRATPSHEHCQSTATTATTTTEMPISHGPDSGDSNSWDWEHASWVEEDHDQFSTWEQVMDQNSNDPSIRLVRWVKTRDVGSRPTPQTNTCATRKRRIDPATRNETRDHATGASAGSLAVPIMEMDDTVVDEGACQDATAVHRGLFVSQVLSSDDCLSQWQCLEDAGCRYGFE